MQAILLDYKQEKQVFYSFFKWTTLTEREKKKKDLRRFIPELIRMYHAWGGDMKEIYKTVDRLKTKKEI